MAIIGILAAVAIPGYIGMQERGRKGAIQRAAVSSEPDIQGWLQSARKGGSSTREADTNGNGIIDSSDLTNSNLANVLASADGLCNVYISAKWQSIQEYSPWDPSARLWTTEASSNTTTNGRISCNHSGSNPQIILEARDKSGSSIYRKVISGD